MRPSQAEEELREVQAGLREASSNLRTLSVTLYLTGCKPDQIQTQSNPQPGSTGEVINALLSTKDPETGEPYCAPTLTLTLPLALTLAQRRASPTVRPA